MRGDEVHGGLVSPEAESELGPLKYFIAYFYKTDIIAHMKKNILNIVIALTSLVTTSVLAQVPANTPVDIQPLYSFPSATITNGVSPTGQLLLGTDGYLYGTAKNGGYYTAPDGTFCGTLYRVSPTNGSFSNLLSFNFTDGCRPNGDLVQVSGNLYGVTASGGSGYQGELFASTTGGVITPLYGYQYSPPLGFLNGAYPVSGVISATNGSATYLVGTTPVGGTYNSGTIYEISTSGTGFTTLYNFNGTGTNVPWESGANPGGRVIQAVDANLYGTAASAGSNNVGFIYVCSMNGNYTNLFSFVSASTGGSPSGRLVQTTDGSLYGVTMVGSTNGYGAVYRMLTNTFVVNTLAAFNNVNGAYPVGGLLQSPVDGYLYGVCSTFSNVGNIFQASTNLTAGALTNMAVFSTTNGATPSSMLVYDTNTTNFYGVTSAGGNGNGVIYEFIPYPVLSATNGTQTSSTGNTRVLTVTAQGIPPFTYQWFHTNTGSAIGPGINGSLTAVLTITNVATSNLGTYTCLVSNAYGIASNFTAILQ